MAAVQHHYNQLKFNLDMPAMPANMAVKFSRPEPIVIEKFGGSLPNQPASSLLTLSGSPSRPAFNFSAVSEDRLSMAIQLAKRDIKKQKELVEQERLSQDTKKKVAGGKASAGGVKAKIVHSKEYKDKLKKRQEKKSTSKTLPVKERVKMGEPKSSTTQTKSSGSRPSSGKSHKNPSGILHVQTEMMSMSPPTRDTDPDKGLTQDERLLLEIEKLRKEMHKCLEQIKQIDEFAKQGIVPALQRRPEEPEDLPDFEIERRRAARADEQAARSGRMIYALQNQVKDICQELEKLKPGQIKANRKSQILRRLATAHRQAVRALQALVNQLPDHNLRQGLPKAYHELSLLVRQLSLCCAQLEIAGESGVPDGVVNLIQDMANINSALERELHASPPHPSRHDTDSRQRSPVSRQLFQPGLHIGPSQGIIKKGVISQPKSIKAPHENLGVQTADRLSKNIHNQLEAVGTTPDRESALRQGIAALLRAADSPARVPRTPTRRPPVVPPLNLPRTPRGKQGVAWDIPLETQQPQGKKGLLLPSGLQAKRDKAQHTRVVLPREAHYTEPTVSSKLKIVPPHERPPPTSPKSPRRPASPYRSARTASPGRYSIPNSPWNTAKREIARQIWLDREAMKQVNDLEEQRQLELQRIQQMRSELGKPVDWVEEAERKIKTQLKPLLEKAEVELNTDTLADMILHDVLDDTAHELEGLVDEEEVDEEASLMQKAPTIESLFQQLKKMEEEQDEIRRRWHTLEYEDEGYRGSRRAMYFDAPGSERPTTPQPIQLSKAIHDEDEMRKPRDLRKTLDSEININPDAIVFTKARPKTVIEEHMHLSRYPPTGSQDDQVKASSLQGPDGDGGIHLYLTQEIIDSIHANKEVFEEYLKKTSSASVGRFNPWQIVEEMADEIMNECIEDVSKELEDINNDIINHIYQSEFKQLPGEQKSGQSESPGEGKNNNAQAEEEKQENI